MGYGPALRSAAFALVIAGGAGALPGAAFADDDDAPGASDAPKSFPRLEGKIEIENHANVFNSDNPGAPDADIYNKTEIDAGWYFNRVFSLQGGFVFEPVRDADPGDTRAFEDHGLYVEQIYAQFDYEPFRIFAGKFNPAFGKAWDLAPGIFGKDLAEDTYQLTERIGGGVAVTQKAGGLGSLTVTGSAFFLDTTGLQGSAFNSRDFASDGAGVPGNTGALDSFELSVDGADIPSMKGVSYALAYLHQAKGELNGGADEDFTDQDAFAFTLYGNHKLNGVGLKWIGEAVYIDGFLADEDSNNFQSWFLTAGAQLKVDRYNIAVAYTFNQNDGFGTRSGDDFNVQQFQISGGVEIYDGWELDLGYKYLQERDEDTHVVGLMLAKEIEFNTGKLNRLKSEAGGAAGAAHPRLAFWAALLIAAAVPLCTGMLYGAAAVGLPDAQAAAVAGLEPGEEFPAAAPHRARASTMPTPFRTPRAISTSSANSTSRSATASSPSCGCPRRLRRNPQTASGRCSTPDPASPAISRTGAATRPRQLARERRGLHVPAPVDPPATAAADKAKFGVLADASPSRPMARSCRTSSIQGHVAEGQIHIDYTESRSRLAAARWSRCARRPIRIDDLGYGPLHPDTHDFPAHRPADDRPRPDRGDPGRSDSWPAPTRTTTTATASRGRPNWVREPGGPARDLGRFGWKAGKPTIAQQSADAFAGDMGISSPLLDKPSGECTEAQAACLDAPNGSTPPGTGAEINKELFDLVVFYSQNLAVPARRDPAAAEVLHGKRLFSAIGCASCHAPPPPPARPRTRRICPTRPSGPIPTSCCTTWARALPTTGPSARRPAANGARLRSGASA